jgi:hypothetical protein
MKIQKLTILFFGLLLWICTGCGTPDKAMQSYVGHHYSELVANWGAPQQQMSDGKGGQIWIYLRTRSFQTQGESSTTSRLNGYSSGSVNNNDYTGRSTYYGDSQTTYTPSRQITRVSRRTFFIDGQGIVYRYAWQN